MSWLSAAWKRNRGAIGNFAKNVSPLLAFTPLGLAGTAITAGLGEAMRPGKNAADILKAGASNAAIGAGARGAVGLAKSAFAPGSSAAGTAAANAAPSVGEATSYMSPAAGSYGQAASAAAPSVASAAAPAVAGGGGASSASLLSRLAGAAKDNPLVIGQIASGVLGAREQGQQNALQREQFDFSKQQYSDEQRRREEMARLLAPLFQQMMNNARTPIAPNPYYSGR